LLEGRNVNLRVVEKEDLPLLAKWNNDPEFGGEYEPFEQSSYAEFEKWFNGLQNPARKTRQKPGLADLNLSRRAYRF
jgi:RimJ/RimL family protein N-acetyltransferase